MIDSAGKPVVLNSVNLGDWLLWEGWRMGCGFKSESDVKKNLLALVGKKTYDKFLKTYYATYVTEKDIALIATSGYNSTRVPFNHWLFTQNNLDYMNGYNIVDSLVKRCRKNKIYMVLDLHTAPGGQTPYFIADPSKTGFYESAENRQATIDLWKAIAARYQAEKIIAGYDILNEPDTKTADLISFYKKLIDGI
ncbi:MAG: hypothetical protein C4308_01335 [Chitinophagaceae bacterium]